MENKKAIVDEMLRHVEERNPFTAQRRKMEKHGAKWVHKSKSKLDPAEARGTYKKPKP